MRLSSRAVSWILILTLSLSPLMAQQQPAPKITALDESGAVNGRVVQVVDGNNNPLVGTSILMAVPSSFPSNPTIPAPETKAPGKTKSTIVALLLLGGAATAIILALSGGGDKPAPAPVVTPTTVQPTIITAGTPRVNSPN
jgi:hypothetical protein